VPYLSASAVVIHYEEALYQVCAPLPYLPLAYGEGMLVPSAEASGGPNACPQINL